MRWFWVWLRKWYESRINLRNGYLCFLANVAFIQLTHEEYVDLNAPSKFTGTVRVTSQGMRPVLTFKFWPTGEEWKKTLPFVSVIIEEKRLLARNVPVKKGDPEGEWETVTIEDPRVAPLEPLFHAFAFYQPLRADHKKKLSEAPSLKWQCDICQKVDGEIQHKQLLVCAPCSEKLGGPIDA